MFGYAANEERTDWKPKSSEGYIRSKCEFGFQKCLKLTLAFASSTAVFFFLLIFGWKKRWYQAGNTSKVECKAKGTIEKFFMYCAISTAFWRCRSKETMHFFILHSSSLYFAFWFVIKTFCFHAKHDIRLTRHAVCFWWNSILCAGFLSIDVKQSPTERNEITIFGYCLHTIDDFLNAIANFTKPFSHHLTQHNDITSILI